MRDGARDGKTATIRCARICFHWFVCSDYPELVSPTVAGGTFMGEIIHIRKFPWYFLNSVANVVKD